MTEAEAAAAAMVETRMIGRSIRCGYDMALRERPPRVVPGAPGLENPIFPVVSMAPMAMEATMAAAMRPWHG
jgi:hypothetical protein